MASLPLRSPLDRSLLPPCRRADDIDPPGVTAARNLRTGWRVVDIGSAANAPSRVLLACPHTALIGRALNALDAAS
jgi:hypothetical protein